MFERLIFPKLLAHLFKQQATVITGMRSVGKTTALRFLLDRVGHDNKLYLDFERVENRLLFD